MNSFAPIFLLFLAIPIVEIWLLIKLGAVIGATWTVMLVVATAVIGAGLVRAQGLSTMGRIQRSMQQGKMPAMEVFEGMALFLAGALLVTPGFVTDTIGFCLLVPGLRRRIIKSILMKSIVSMGSSGGGRPGSGQGYDQGHEQGERHKPLDGQWRRED